MAKIKHTKNALKAERDALVRFERYLPMLVLKKQQLQTEIQAIDARIAEVRDRESAVRLDLDGWVRLFADPDPLEEYSEVLSVEVATGNIAGVIIPVYEGVTFGRSPIDLFETAPWVDDGVKMVEKTVRLRVEIEVLQEQRRLVSEELRITNQRVNLFEKVKIPECRENIRVIRIFLGDEQTAAVARGKIAKARNDAIQLGEDSVVDEWSEDHLS